MLRSRVDLAIPTSPSSRSSSDGQPAGLMQASGHTAGGTTRRSGSGFVKALQLGGITIMSLIVMRRDDRRAVLDDAWAELHAATPPGWHVGQPSEHPERHEWLMYAFDPSERPVVGLRRREWTAISETEEGVVREMARCLREIAEGRVPT